LNPGNLLNFLSASGEIRRSSDTSVHK